MTAAFAPAHFQPDFSQTLRPDAASAGEASGAHTLLGHHRIRPSYLTQGAAVILYALALGGLCYLARPQSVPQEQPLELVMVPDDAPPPAPAPVVTPPTPEPPPPVAETPPQEPPPPVAAQEDEPVAPVLPPPPPPPVQKAELKHKQKPKTFARSTTTRTSVAAGKIPPNAVPSYYANMVHARIARVAANSYPRSALLHHESARVSYHVVISPSGDIISKSITPSGNPTFDSAAAEALARAAPFPSTGVARPVSLYGAIAYRLN